MLIFVGPTATNFNSFKKNDQRYQKFFLSDFILGILNIVYKDREMNFNEKRLKLI